MKQSVLLVIGTRPEAIKVMPVYFELKKKNIPVKICSTFQHSFLLQEIFDVFGVKPDYSLDIMKVDQTLTHITTSVLNKISIIFQSVKPSLVLVQGDTTTAFTAALAAYYYQIPVGHIEAGLRTGDKLSPYPEEFNRQAISLISDLNFTPTNMASEALINYGIKKETIYKTGNTVVDSLLLMKKKIEDGSVIIKESIKRYVNEGKKIILMTLHRRESFSGELQEVLEAIRIYASQNRKIQIIYPHHPNPQVLEAISMSGIKQEENIIILKPLIYQDLIYLLMRANLILTDSGGIQEEAVSLGKTVIVARKKTERMEGVVAGLAHLVGTEKEAILSALNKFIHTKEEKNTFIFGDGTAAQQIVSIIKSNWAINENSMRGRSGVYRASNSDSSC